MKPPPFARRPGKHGWLRGLLAVSTACGVLLASPAWSQGRIETIVMLRHGEKPKQGLGQLNCQGLNRALALPAVLARQFGTPDVIFAPNPAIQKTDSGKLYDYVRPLATIEPTAIRFGLPIDANIGFSNDAALRAALQQPAYHSALIMIAWEHHLIETIARKLLADNGGNAAHVPKWHSDDFDSIYVVSIDWSGTKPKASFSQRAEGLNQQPGQCP